MSTKDKVYNFRTYANKIEAANQVLKANHTDLPTVFNDVLDQIILTEKVPVKSKKDLRADAFLDDLSHELTSDFSKLEAGEFVSQAAAEKRLGI